MDSSDTDKQEHGGSEHIQLTPTKDSERSDGNFGTPQKRRLDFDFWNKSKSKKMNLNEGPVNIADLVAVNEFAGRIRFRVCFKSTRRATKAGTMFSFHAMDNSGEIAVTLFRDHVEKYFDMIHVNGTYELTNFNVKDESPEYPSGTGHTFQLSLSGKAELAVVDDDSSIPGIPFNFITIDKLHELNVKSRADLVGILVKDWGVETTSKGTVKRDLSLTDKSKSTVNLTMWGTSAQDFAGQLFSPLVVRKAMIGEFQGKTTLTCAFDTLVWVEPEVQDGNELAQWFQAELKEADSSDDQ